MEKFKKSKYNLELKIDNKNYIFNSLLGSCISFSEKEYLNYLNEDFSNFSKKDLDSLIELGIVTQESVNETQIYLNLLEKENLNEKKRFYRILTTTDCNAKCYYCYEKGVKVESMDDNTANKVADFIIGRQNGIKDLRIQFFGGEPLCNTRAIDIISNRINDAGLSFYGTMTTNGFLFDKDIVVKAKEIWNVKKVQITLDGTKKIYEKIKQFKTPNAYERVLKNIQELSLHGIKVTIRLNYCENTKEDIIKLIKELSFKFGKNKNVNVYAYRLFEDEKNDNTEQEINNCLVENGFYNKEELDFPKVILNPCMARRSDSLVILPNGDLAKCSRGIQLNNGIIGDIYNNNFANNLWERLNEKCLSCKLLPLCGGGCKCEELMEKNFCSVSEQQILKKLYKIIKRKGDHL